MTVPELDLDRYASVTLPAARWMDRSVAPRCYPASAAALPEVARAVYVAFDCDGQVVYVGSVARATGGVRERFCQHQRSRWEARWWSHMWVVALRDDTPTEVVRELEGVIGRRLAPTGNQRLPKVRGAA